MSACSRRAFNPYHQAYYPHLLTSPRFTAASAASFYECSLSWSYRLDGRFVRVEAQRDGRGGGASEGRFCETKGAEMKGKEPERSTRGVSQQEADVQAAGGEVRRGGDELASHQEDRIDGSGKGRNNAAADPVNSKDERVREQKDRTDGEEEEEEEEEKEEDADTVEDTEFDRQLDTILSSLIQPLCIQPRMIPRYLSSQSKQYCFDDYPSRITTEAGWNGPALSDLGGVRGPLTEITGDLGTLIDNQVKQGGSLCGSPLPAAAVPIMERDPPPKRLVMERQRQQRKEKSSGLGGGEERVARMVESSSTGDSGFGFLSVVAEDDYDEGIFGATDTSTIDTDPSPHPHPHPTFRDNPESYNDNISRQPPFHQFPHLAHPGSWLRVHFLEELERLERLLDGNGSQNRMRKRGWKESREVITFFKMMRLASHLATFCQRSATDFRITEIVDIEHETLGVEVAAASGAVGIGLAASNLESASLLTAICQSFATDLRITKIVDVGNETFSVEVDATPSTIGVALAACGSAEGEGWDAGWTARTSGDGSGGEEESGEEEDDDLLDGSHGYY
ncbi:hypothetical protein HK102_006632 [Quaeritorhiza haematococci]|nr:hypothetical protein HK102_006632 [Quaeritorhiza haematococci]